MCRPATTHPSFLIAQQAKQTSNHGAQSEFPHPLAAFLRSARVSMCRYVRRFMLTTRVCVQSKKGQKMDLGAFLQDQSAFVWPVSQRSLPGSR